MNKIDYVNGVLIIVGIFCFIACLVAYNFERNKNKKVEKCNVGDDKKQPGNCWNVRCQLSGKCRQPKP